MKASKYEELFRENVVMTIERLKLATGQPRESILRDLKGIGYYTSYNARGKFYTLGSTPEFDEFGLWKYQNAYFSFRRTLLDTAEHLVNASNAGCTHDELRQVLGIGVQNSLYQLTTAGRISRSRIGDQYVYFGNGAAGGQLDKRSAMPTPLVVRKAAKTPGAQSRPDIDPALIIDILVAVLRGHETDSAVLSYLDGAGSTATPQQVMTVFRHYGIGKKNSPAQK